MTTHSPALSSLIDIHAFYSRYSQVVGKPTNSKDGKEYHGSCPKCGGTDRFAFWESGRFSCSIRSSGCDISGSSPYWFLRDVERLTHRQACEDLGIDLDQFDEFYQQNKRALPLFMTQDEEPCKKWIDAASAFTYRAERYLWSDKGKKALEYLLGRGLNYDTIKQARLGYCPGWYHESLENWGLTSIQTLEETEIKIPEGIIIPWFVDGKIWKLSVRRWKEGYFQVLGSSDALYNIDAVEDGKSIILVESEFDALSIVQTSGDIIATVATGGTSKGQSLRWIHQLKQAPGLLIAFDTDEAGTAGAAEWKKKLPDALRWKPWAHDANQMLQEKQLIRTWIELGLKTFHVVIEAPANPVQIIPENILEPIPEPIKPTLTKRKPLDPWIKTNDKGLPLYCSHCTMHNKAIAWKSNAIMMEAYCSKHMPETFGW